jgi:alkaline phosphatase D
VRINRTPHLVAGVGALGLVLGAVGLLAGPTAAPGTPLFTSGVASGDVTPTSAILWTRVDRDTSVKVEVWSTAALAGPKAFQKTIPHASAEHDFTLKVDATGLAPATTYFFRFRHGDGNADDAASSDVGTFRTAPAPDAAVDVRATYSGDADGTRLPSGAPAFNDFEVLKAARLEGGDFFVFDGDTIYSDSFFRTTGPATTLAEYQAAHRENRGYANLRRLLAATSVYATMDDHEVVNDYDGQTVDPARFAAGRQAFLDYYPVRETGLLQDATCAGAPLYRKFRWGSQVEVFLLDERSCRSADVAAACHGDLAPTLPGPVRTLFPFSLLLTPAPPPGCVAAILDPARTLLGPMQNAQLRADLLESTAKWKLVVSEEPIQQFHALPYDRWEGYAADRNALLAFLHDNAITGVKFLSTDIHATLQNQVAIDHFVAPARVADELVTGPIATTTFQAQVLALAGQLGLAGLDALLTLDGVDCRNLNTNSYALVEVAAGAGTISLTSKDQNGAAVMDTKSPAACTAIDGP